MNCELPSLSERQLQTVSASLWLTLTMAFGSPIGIILYFFLLITRFWWLAVLYSFWLYHDRKTPETGGRSNHWTQSWRTFSYFKDYFPATLINPELPLNPRRNYLFACFPHGLFPSGSYNNILSHASEFRQLYPSFKVHIAALHILSYTPFVRELGLALGLISCSAKSLDYLLSKPEGGQIVVLSPGGASETFNVGHKQYKFVVKNRKGFVKVALRNGTTLVPVITFNENKIYRQFQNETVLRVRTLWRNRLDLCLRCFMEEGSLRIHSEWYRWGDRWRLFVSWLSERDKFTN